MSGFTVALNRLICVLRAPIDPFDEPINQNSMDHVTIVYPGQSFDQVIERELETARASWCCGQNIPFASEWVKNEAAVASERGVLVPASVESVKLPFEFRHKQTADLVGWKGDPSHSGFQALCEGISATLGISPPHSSISGLGDHPKTGQP